MTIIGPLMVHRGRPLEGPCRFYVRIALQGSDSLGSNEMARVKRISARLRRAGFRPRLRASRDQIERRMRRAWRMVWNAIEMVIRVLPRHRLDRLRLL